MTALSYAKMLWRRTRRRLLNPSTRLALLLALLLNLVFLLAPAFLVILAFSKDSGPPFAFVSTLPPSCTRSGGAFPILFSIVLAKRTSIRRLLAASGGGRVVDVVAR